MSEKIYQWKRFWCLRGGQINTTDDGYLFDPESEYGHIYNPDVVTFDQIAHFPCLVLLGEPGIGKSNALNGEKDAIIAHSLNKGEKEPIWIDLRSIGSEERLEKKVFEHERFTEWCKDDSNLTILFDSLDECQLQIKTIATLLLDEFGGYDTHRLQLRIACRTADWPAVLEDGLKNIWEDKNVGIFELAPLRRRDVKEAAVINGIDAECFFTEIHRTSAVPFAIKPITLNMLINLYRLNKTLPSTQIELYEKGCQKLCEEINMSRRSAGFIGIFTAKQRFAVASRIAALTVFTDRYGIWTGIDSEIARQEDILISDLAYGTEQVEGGRFNVTEDAVRETLGTGLFSAYGKDRMGWAHKTYSEFLAAHYLVRNNLEISQMMNLIIHPGDREKKITPQLYETASWLAIMVPEIFRNLMITDPEVLKTSDVTAVGEEDRANLVDALLKLYDSGYAWDDLWTFKKSDAVLFHKDIEAQIKYYMSDKKKNICARRFAINLADGCKVKNLQKELTDIVLDSSEPMTLRINAAHAIVKFGDKETRMRLKPFVFKAEDDENEEGLKEFALEALWPDLMTSDELFSALIHPRSNKANGSYDYFIKKILLNNFDQISIIPALKWTKDLPHLDSLHPFVKLSDHILYKAWQQLESPGIVDIFSQIVCFRLKNCYEIIHGELKENFEKELDMDFEKRHMILFNIIRMIPNPEKESIYYLYQLTRKVDIFWMIKMLEEGESDREKHIWALLVDAIFDRSDTIHTNAIFKASKRDPVMEKQFREYFEAIPLDSEKAKKMQEYYLLGQNRGKVLEEKPSSLEVNPELQMDLDLRIDEALNNIESGEIDAWGALNVDVMREKDGKIREKHFYHDIEIFPGWKNASPDRKARIIKAAEKYLLNYELKTEGWFGYSIGFVPVVAGYRALLLMFQEARKVLEGFAAVIFSKWLPVLVVFPSWDKDYNERSCVELLKLAYISVPDDFINMLIALIDVQNERHNHISVTHRIECFIDERLKKALLLKAAGKNMKPEAMASLIEFLMKIGYTESKEFLESLITIPVPCRGVRKDKVITAARLLINHSNDSWWQRIWPVIQEEPEFGRELFLSLTAQSWVPDVSVTHQLSEEQLKALYIWLAREFPCEEDPAYNESRMSDRENLARWRNAVFDHIVKRGTNKACKAIKEIIGEFPHNDWLKLKLSEAHSITRKNTWIPPPEHVNTFETLSHINLE
ncbi:MAG: hypothetical protein AB2L14_36540 [Candidatus Xenobiia bacterium LiM19]